MNPVETITTPWQSPRKDCLKHSEIADKLADLLKEKKPEDNGSIFNVTADLGGGKTFFLQNWAKQLQQSEQHFSGYISFLTPNLSPLETFLAQFTVQFPSLVKKRKLAKLNKIAGRLMAAKKDRSFQEIVLSEQLSNEQAPWLVAAWNNLLEHLGIKPKSDPVFRFIKAFKKTLEEIMQQMTKKNVPLPMIVMVDELDRCAPWFAAEVLECLKHLFKSSHLTFVVATQGRQFRESMQKVYGQGFDVAGLTKYFFDKSYPLPVPTDEQYHNLAEQIAASFEWKQHLSFIVNSPFSTEEHSVQLSTDGQTPMTYAQGLVWAVKAFDLDFRSFDQLNSHVIAISRHLPKNTTCHGIVLLIWVGAFLHDRNLFEQMIIYLAKHPPLHQADRSEGLEKDENEGESTKGADKIEAEEETFPDPLAYLDDYPTLALQKITLNRTEHPPISISAHTLIKNLLERWLSFQAINHLERFWEIKRWNLDEEPNLQAISFPITEEQFLQHDSVQDTLSTYLLTASLPNDHELFSALHELPERLYNTLPLDVYPRYIRDSDRFFVD